MDHGLEPLSALLQDVERAFEISIFAPNSYIRNRFSFLSLP